MRTTSRACSVCGPSLSRFEGGKGRKNFEIYKPIVAIWDVGPFHACGVLWHAGLIHSEIDPLLILDFPADWLARRSSAARDFGMKLPRFLREKTDTTASGFVGSAKSP